MKISRVLIAVTTIALTGCGHNHTTENEHEGIEVERSHDDEIVLSPTDAERFGVETEKVEYSPLNQAIKVTGQIEAPAASVYTVSAHTSGKVTLGNNIVAGSILKQGQHIGTISAQGFEGGDQSAAASARLEAAQKELDRLRPLYKEGLVSQKEFTAAEAEYNIAKASSSGTKGGSAVTSPASGRVSRLLVSQNQFVSAGEPILELTDTRQLALRADLPVRYSGKLPEIISARFVTPSSDTIYDLTEMNGRLATGTNNMVSQNGYIPVQFYFDNNVNSVAGTYADVYLVCQTTDSCITLPRSAITEELGAKFVFVKVDDHGYEKRNVATGSTDGKRTAILSGLKPGEEVVTKGVVFVKLAQTKNNMPEGHSHNH